MLYHLLPTMQTSSSAGLELGKAPLESVPRNAVKYGYFFFHPRKIHKKFDVLQQQATAPPPTLPPHGLYIVEGPSSSSLRTSRGAGKREEEKNKRGRRGLFSVIYVTLNLALLLPPSPFPEGEKSPPSFSRPPASSRL